MLELGTYGSIPTDNMKDISTAIFVINVRFGTITHPAF